MFEDVLPHPIKNEENAILGKKRYFWLIQISKDFWKR